jgi:PAS domain S-box-containing protein
MVSEFKLFTIVSETGILSTVNYMSTNYENAWNTLMQQSKFPWWEWDIKTNTVRFNDLKVTRLGYDPKDFNGKGYQAFTDLIHPDDHERAMEAMMAVLRGDTRLYQIDYRIKTAKQDYLWYMDRGIVVKEDGTGNPLVIRGLVIDLGSEASRGAGIDALKSVIYASGTSDTTGHSILTICASCKKARKDRDVWIELPPDLSDYIGERITHSICPGCIRDLYPDIADDILREMK